MKMLSNTSLAILIPIIVVVVVIAIVLTICIISNKQKEYILKTSTRLNELKEINAKYRELLGSPSAFDIIHTIRFNSKKQLESFYYNDKRINSLVYELEDLVYPGILKIAKNELFKDDYYKEIHSIQSTNMIGYKKKYFLSEDDYLEIEEKVFNSLIFKDIPDDFLLRIFCKYTSPKGRNNYEYEIQMDSGKILAIFNQHKKDLLLKATTEIFQLDEEKNKPFSFKDNSLISKPKEKGIRTYPNSVYQNLIGMDYQSLISHLLHKYGPVSGDYFLTPTCKSKNQKITRGDEALFIHHMDENVAINLSDTRYAVESPFEYQKADRLVYADILEHLLLHIKIAEEHSMTSDSRFAGIGGAVEFICRQINDCYSDREFSQKSAIILREYLKDKFNDYIVIMRHFITFLQEDAIYHFLLDKQILCVGFDGRVVGKVADELFE